MPSLPLSVRHWGSFLIPPLIKSGSVAEARFPNLLAVIAADCGESSPLLIYPSLTPRGSSADGERRGTHTNRASDAAAARYTNNVFHGSMMFNPNLWWVSFNYQLLKCRWRNKWAKRNDFRVIKWICYLILRDFDGKCLSLFWDLWLLIDC